MGAREARARAGVHVMTEVFGAFTRALRDADLQKCEVVLVQASWPAETGDRARSADRHSPV
jgi:hypothetical protein